MGYKNWFVFFLFVCSLFFSSTLFLHSTMRFTHLATVLALVSSTMAATSSKYCSGSKFAVKSSICGKFQFNKLSNSGQCTDSSKKTQGVFSGTKLSNCTTWVPLPLMNHRIILGIFYSHTQFIRFYDISMLPNQTMDATAIKMAELITNV